MLLCIGCQWQLKPNNADDDNLQVRIQRYDRIESLYLTTGDYAALQQMNTYFPTQTRTLIEDVIGLGQVNDPDINNKFLRFFQDSTLQAMLQAVQQQFADLDDINDDLTSAFERLKEELPSLRIPEVYTQIGTFDQSIIVGHRHLGISLDKYLGADYPFYHDHYSEKQRSMMVRSMIVPDCLGFYLMSLFPLQSDNSSQHDHDVYMGRIQWVVNEITRRDVFDSEFVKAAGRLMKDNNNWSFEQLLRHHF
jgi:hypothetical protein